MARVNFGSYPVAGYSITGRHLIYGQSVFNTSDLASQAPDKVALLPGATPGFQNVSSYVLGINGLAVDVSRLPPTGTPSWQSLFRLRVSAGAASPADPKDASSWAPAPNPSAIFIHRGVPDGDRILLLWPSGAIQNQWLEVTVLPGSFTGITEPDVFYFGSLVGETGDAAGPLRVSALDLATTRRALNAQQQDLSSRVDFNRDGRVNAIDLAAVKRNLNTALAAPPASAPTSPAVPARATDLLNG